MVFPRASHRIGAALLLSCVAFLLVRCGDGTAPEPVYVALHVAPDSADIFIADTVSLAAALESESGELVAASQATWSSRDPNVVSMCAPGCFVGVGAGIGHVEAAAHGLVGGARIVVRRPDEPVGLSISPPTAELVAGDTLRFQAEYRLADGSREDATGAATWSSLHPDVVDVDSTGLATAVQEGSALVVAEASGFRAEALVLVEATVVPVDLFVRPDSAMVVVGHNLRLGAWLVTEAGDTLVAPRVTWSSLAPSVASVDGTGLATGVSQGEATVVAEAAGFDAEASLSVLDVVSLVFTPDTLRLAPGDTGGITAAYLLQDGDTVPAVEKPALWSFNPSVATVQNIDSVAVVIARSVGWGKLGVAVPGLVDTVDVIVADGGPWFGLPPMPGPQSSGCAVVVDGKIYYVGDYVTYVFDPAVQAWSSLSGSPNRREASACAVLGRTIFVMGGYPSRMNDAYRTDDDVWELRAPLPVSGAEVRADTLGGRIYVAGAGTDQDEVWIYDAEADSWSAAPGLNVGRQGFAMGSVAGKLFVAGGDGEELMSLEILDLAVGSWVVGANGPFRSSGMASVVAGHELVVMGGRLSYSQLLDDVAAYNAETGNWTILADMPSARGRARGVFLDGLIYVLGGDLYEERPTNRVDGWRWE
jgi:uncharacterized protein YjdB